MQAAGQAIGNAAAGNLPGFFSGARNTWNSVKLPEPVRDQMGKIMLSKDRRGLLDLEDTMRQVEESRRMQAASYGVALPGIGPGGLLY